jgi:predicted nucleic acid-binding protein
MSGKVFLDTNVLVYLYDEDAPQKQARARSVLASSDSQFFISTQILQEFYVTVTRKFSKRMPEEAVLEAMHRLRALATVQVNARLIFEAIDVRRRFQLSFWDALVVRSALEAGCTLLLSEDLQHQMKIGSLTIENPFEAVGFPTR